MMMAQQSSGNNALAAVGRVVRAGEKAVVAAGLLMIVVCVLWGVTTRYISQKPAVWTGELASIAFAWICMVGAGLLYGSGGHPRIYDPTKIGNDMVRSIAIHVDKAIQFVVLFAIATLSIKQIYLNIDNATSVLGIPVAIYYLPLVWFGLSSMARLISKS